MIITIISLLLYLYFMLQTRLQTQFKTQDFSYESVYNNFIVLAY
ncbi:hypothetical protein RICGR_0644 [Rickettsiella grylli]|uniref:Uncharacterized protein n=1 Tax=Rickettsiella grylli TaxID=59196 RepID=A8PM74_9COXI|nr:hypothetical protein RICGR_0644 [Rickettsiella grylli]